MIVARARRLASFEDAVDFVDWSEWSDDERRRCVVYACYEIRRRGTPVQRRGRRRALRLFRSWLSSAEREQLRRCGRIHVRGSVGGCYRINPYVGVTERVELHGKHWFRRTTFCYHDAESSLPDADVALAHYLLIRSDEREFILRANEHVPSWQMWNPDYARRLMARREMAAL